MTITTIQPALIDTYIRVTIDGTYGTTNYGTSTQLESGENLGINFDKSRSLIKFELPTAVAVTTATLSLYEFGENADTTRVHSIYRLKRVWVETEATWTIYSTGNDWQTAGATGANDYDSTAIGTISLTGSEAAGWKDISLNTTAVLEMMNGTFANNGFIMMAATETNDWHKFYSSNYAVDATKCPKLYLDYTPSGLSRVIII